MLARKVAFGAAWLAGSRIASRGLDALAMLLVARLLTPADFGLVALASAVIFILTSISDLSLSNALIQMRDPPKEAYDTAFTLNVMRGALLAGVTVAIAFPYAQVYDDQRLVPLLLTLGVGPFLQSLTSPRLAHFARELHFQPIVVREIAARAAAFVVSIAVAYATESYWALVAGRLAASVMTLATSYRLAPYRPSFNLSYWRRLLSFSTWLTLSQTLNALNFQIDRFMIGGWLGKSLLGQYVLGSELAALPTQAPLQPMMQALYSGMAKIAHDVDQLRAAYLDSQALILFMILPLGFLASGLAEPLVMLALGPAWSASGHVVAVLAPIFALQLMSAPANALCMAQGRTRSIFWRDFIVLCLRVPLIIVGLTYASLEGVLCARLISGLAMIYLNLSLCGQLLNLNVIDQIAVGWRSIVCALFIFIYSYSFSIEYLTPLPAYSTSIVMIGVCVLSSCAIYVFAHFAMWLAVGRPRGPETRIVTVFKSFFKEKTI